MFQMCSTNNRCPQQSVASLTNIFLLEDLLGRVEEHHTYLCVCFWFCAHFAVLDCFYTKKHGKSTGLQFFRHFGSCRFGCRCRLPLPLPSRFSTAVRLSKLLEDFRGFLEDFKRILEDFKCSRCARPTTDARSKASQA